MCRAAGPPGSLRPGRFPLGLRRALTGVGLSPWRWVRRRSLQVKNKSQDARRGCGCRRWTRFSPRGLGPACLLPPQPLAKPHPVFQAPLLLIEGQLLSTSVASLRAAPHLSRLQITQGTAFPPLVSSSFVQQQLVEFTVSEGRQTQIPRQISNRDKVIKRQTPWGEQIRW